MKRKWMCMLVCLLALSVGQAAAQRCLPGMQAVEMRGGMLLQQVILPAWV